MIPIANASAIKSMQKTSIVKTGNQCSQLRISTTFVFKILIFSYFYKCDRKGSCADVPVYDATGRLIGWDAINDCQGKICRHKCRCAFRFIHSFGERQVYRQITHVWDGGNDYYTGSQLKKYNKRRSITRRFRQSEVAAGRGSPIKRFR